MKTYVSIQNQCKVSLGILGLFRKRHKGRGLDFSDSRISRSGPDSEKEQVRQLPSTPSTTASRRSSHTAVYVHERCSRCSMILLRFPNPEGKQNRSDKVEVHQVRPESGVEILIRATRSLFRVTLIPSELSHKIRFFSVRSNSDSESVFSRC